MVLMFLKNTLRFQFSTVGFSRVHNSTFMGEYCKVFLFIFCAFLVNVGFALY
jgi:hypothetical protein